MENVQVISGRLFLKVPNGNAVVHFRDHAVTGDAEVSGEGNPNGSILGPRNLFMAVLHVIVSLNDANLSTSGNTFYHVRRTVREDSLSLEWEIDRAGGELKLDFLVIGEPAN